MPIVVSSGAPAITGLAAFTGSYNRGGEGKRPDWMEYLRQREAQQLGAQQKLLELYQQQGQLQANWNREMQWAPAAGPAPDMTDPAVRQKRVSNNAARRRGKPLPFPEIEPDAGGKWVTRSSVDQAALETQRQSGAVDLEERRQRAAVDLGERNQTWALELEGKRQQGYETRQGAEFSHQNAIEAERVEADYDTWARKGHDDGTFVLSPDDEKVLAEIDNEERRATKLLDDDKGHNEAQKAEYRLQIQQQHTRDARRVLRRVKPAPKPSVPKFEDVVQVGPNGELTQWNKKTEMYEPYSAKEDPKAAIQKQIDDLNKALINIGDPNAITERIDTLQKQLDPSYKGSVKPPPPGSAPGAAPAQGQPAGKQGTVQSAQAAETELRALLSEVDARGGPDSATDEELERIMQLRAMLQTPPPSASKPSKLGAATKIAVGLLPGGGGIGLRGMRELFQ